LASVAAPSEAQPISRVQALVLASLIAVTAGYLLIGVSGTMLLAGDGMRGSTGKAAGGDFMAFYAAAWLAAAGDALAAYDVAALMDAQRRFLSVDALRLPWAYPPPMLVAVRPLALLSPEIALWAWFLVGAIAALALWRVLTRDWVFAPFAVLFPGVAQSLICGQTGTLVALAAAIVFRYWTHAPIAAGVALGCLALKPHFMLAPVVLALVDRRWTMLAAAAVTALALALASLAIDGPAPWFALVEAGRGMLQRVANGDFVMTRMVSLFALLRVLGVPTWPAALAHLLLAAAAVLLACIIWRNTRDQFTRALAFAAATVLAPPYAYDYDLAVLAIPAVLIAARRDGPSAWSRTDMIWMIGLCALPIAAFVCGGGFGVQPTPIILSAMLVLAARPALRGSIAMRAP
jgi:Glycosyltransferase family 87